MLADVTLISITNQLPIEIGMNRCQVCSSPVLERKKRMLLGTSSTAECSDTLITLAKGLLYWDDERAMQEFSNGYICLECYRTVSKYSSSECFLRTELSRRVTGPEVGEIRVTKRKAKQSEQAVKIVVTQSSYEKTYTLSPSKQVIAKSLGRSSHKALFRHVSHHRDLNQSMLRQVGNMLHSEFKVLYTTDFMKSDLQALKLFSWDRLYLVLKSKAPTLFAFLKSCIPEHSTKKKRIVVVCAAILASSHKRWTPVHSYVSVILHAGHAAKQVYSRLQNLGICFSDVTTRKIIDSMGVDHDRHVLDWVQKLKQNISPNQGSIIPAFYSGPQQNDSSPENSCSSSSFGVSVSPSMFPTSSLFNSSAVQTPNEVSPLISFSSMLADIAGCNVEEDSRQSLQIPLSSSSESAELQGHFSELSDDHLEDDDNPVSAPYSSSPQQLQFSLSSSIISSNHSTHSESEKSASQVSSQASSETVSASECDAFGWCGFRIVGDNIDKTVKPRDMRHNHQSASLHYFHAYAVKDRVDVSDLSSDMPLIVSSDIDINVLLPSHEDAATLEANICTLMMRILIKHIPGLGHLSPIELQHIPHFYSDIMMTKSEVVPLGVFLKNENKLDEMMNILDEMHKYVPSLRTVQRFEYSGDGDAEVEEINVDHFCHVLFGGDQLTVARIRGCQKIRKNADNGRMRLDAFIPVVEDWHTKMCFLKMVWSRLYKTSSSLDVGTLYQLRTLINRRNVTSDASKDMNACEDFFELVVSSHVIAAALQKSDTTSMSDFVLKLSNSPTEQLAALSSLVKSICSEFVNISFPKKHQETSDHVQQYAMEVMSLGLLYLEIKDSIREGDGYRVLRCYKYLLPLFRGSGHKNYCIEVLHFLTSYYYTLPPRYAAQMLWGRFINTHGVPGHNISADLHMEHLNRMCKDSVSHLGANKTPAAILRVGKALGPLSELLAKFDASTGIVTTKSHTRRSDEEDLSKLVNELTQSGCFLHQQGRFHHNFKSIKTNGIISCINGQKFTEWIKKCNAEFLYEVYRSS